jgi:hypothetical protein
MQGYRVADAAPRYWQDRHSHVNLPKHPLKRWLKARVSQGLCGLLSERIVGLHRGERPLTYTSPDPWL